MGLEVVERAPVSAPCARSPSAAQAVSSGPVAPPGSAKAPLGAWCACRNPAGVVTADGDRERGEPHAHTTSAFSRRA